jgi:serine/threonine protein kinase
MNHAPPSDAAPPAAGAAEPAESARPSSWRFEAGASIADGRTVLRRLGGGSRYEVFLVWDERLFSLAVAKVLRPDHVSEERALRELRRESDVLGRLAHPVLVRQFAAVFDGPHPHLLLEHIEGPTLGRLIKRERTLPPEQLLPLTLHVAAALQYMHNAGEVHLDVKPSNIVMAVAPRLIDLSIARPFADAAAIRVPIGTDQYMAPEQCDPRAHAGAIGPPADVWGLGATLYHAIAGVVPVPRPRGAGASDDPSVRFPQLHARPAFLPARVPEPLAALVMRMLAEAPAERPSAGEASTVLAELVETLVRKGRRRAR